MSTLESVINAHEARAVSRTVVRKGGERINVDMTNRAVDKLFVSVGGTAYPVFILGQNDIDSTSPEYYVP